MVSGFAANLRAAQFHRGLTNQQVAEALGVNLRLVQKWRAGVVKPNEANQVRLAELLDTTVARFYESVEELSAEGVR